MPGFVVKKDHTPSLEMCGFVFVIDTSISCIDSDLRHAVTHCQDLAFVSRRDCNMFASDIFNDWILVWCSHE